MKIAVISDIHSNIYALESALLDIVKKQVDTIVCTGDLVGYGTRPNEVINTIRENEIITIMGDNDDIIGNYKIIKNCYHEDLEKAENQYLSIIFTSDKTISTNKDFLSSLPEYKVMNINNKSIRFVHGSTRFIDECLREGSIESKEVIKELKEDILVCGHTHIPYVKYYGDKILINAGSVGKPETNNNANYVIINIDEDSSVQVEIVEVEYDFEKLAKEIEEDDILPYSFARMIREGSCK